MDISFALLLTLILAIFAQALFLELQQFVSYHFKPEISTVVLAQLSASVPPSDLLNQQERGGACAAV
jgi:hypothetical protein